VKFYPQRNLVRAAVQHMAQRVIHEACICGVVDAARTIIIIHIKIRNSVLRSLACNSLCSETQKPRALVTKYNILDRILTFKSFHVWLVLLPLNLLVHVRNRAF
jgi:hypothetical protein